MAVVAFAVGMTLLTFLVGSLRWWILLRHSAKHVSFTKILPSYYLGVFFNNILPTTMGGDVVRAIHLGLHGISMKSLIGSTFIDRGVGLFVILGMGIVSLSLSQEITLGTRNSILLAAVASTTLLCLWILFNTGFLKRIGYLTVKYQHTRIRRFLLETLHLCHSYKSARKKNLYSHSADGSHSICRHYFLLRVGKNDRYHAIPYNLFWHRPAGISGGGNSYFPWRLWCSRGRAGRVACEDWR